MSVDIPTKPKQMAKIIPDFTEEQVRRFHSTYKINEETECWEWTGQTKGGYGQFAACKQDYTAHRVAFQLAGNTLDRSLVLDHVCRNKCCVNPQHLRQTTIGQNVLWGDAPPAVNARAGVCGRGHILVYHPKRGRRCQECQKVRQRMRGILFTIGNNQKSCSRVYLVHPPEKQKLR